MHFLTILPVVSFAISGTVATQHVQAKCPQQDIAGGGPPNMITPAMISKDGVEQLQLAYFLQRLEVAFFEENAQKLEGWINVKNSNTSIQAVRAISAQAHIHLLTLHNILKDSRASVPATCNYTFPVNSTKEFFKHAHVITSIGVGATIGLNRRLAQLDPLLVGAISSILTVKARHNSIIRQIQQLSPNLAPFDTGISDIWAYNLVLKYIEPGSCPSEMHLPILARVSISGPMSPESSRTEFTWDPEQESFVTESGKELFISWVSQLNTPIYTSLNVTEKGNGSVDVPGGLSGVAFAAVTVQRPIDPNDLALSSLTAAVAVPIS